MQLRELQNQFFAALSTDDESIIETRIVKGRIDVYRYAYFERIRASLAEDFPRLFHFFEGLDPPISSEAVTTEVLAKSHPNSWTLADAGGGVLAAVDALCPQSARLEARKFAQADAAENEACWVAEWASGAGTNQEKIAAFASGDLRIALSKTWREAAESVYWRTSTGPQDRPSDEFTPYRASLKLMMVPMTLAELSEVCATNAISDQELSETIGNGIAEGWLCLTSDVAFTD